MVYLIIGLAVLFIVVPILAVLPSPRQREQLAMRNAARAAGVLVELTSIDDPIRNRTNTYRQQAGRCHRNYSSQPIVKTENDKATGANCPALTGACSESWKLDGSGRVRSAMIFRLISRPGSKAWLKHCRSMSIR